MQLSATKRNCVKLPYRGVVGGVVTTKHVVLTYANEDVITLGDGEAMYTLWHGSQGGRESGG